MASQTLSRTQSRRKEAVQSDLAEAKAIVERFSIDIYTRLLTRASIPTAPDSLPSSSRLGMGRGGSDDTPIERAVLAREKPRHDELTEVVRLIEWSLQEALHHLIVAEDSMAYTTNVEQEFSQRATSSPCLICLVNSVAKSGYCSKCWIEWQEHGRPDRQRWLLWKQKTINSEQLVLVENCPPPSQGAKASKGPHSRRSRNEDE